MASLSIFWTLGPNMETRVKRYIKTDTHSDWIAPWRRQLEKANLDEAANQIRYDRYWTDDDLVVRYSGNMGLTIPCCVES